MDGNIVKKISLPLLIIFCLGFILSFILTIFFALQSISKFKNKDDCDKNALDLYNKEVGNDKYKVNDVKNITQEVGNSKNLVNIKDKQCLYWDYKNLVCMNGKFSTNGLCNINSKSRKVSIAIIFSIVLFILIIITTCIFLFVKSM